MCDQEEHNLSPLREDLKLRKHLIDCFRVQATVLPIELEEVERVHNTDLYAHAPDGSLKPFNQAIHRGHDTVMREEGNVIIDP